MTGKDAQEEHYESFMKRMDAANTLGRCEFFNIAPFIDAANILVAADEPMRALQLLDNLPAYYRDHIPYQVLNLKSEIYKRLATPAFYLNNHYDLMVRTEYSAKMLDESLRGAKIWQSVKEYNEKGLVPHIVDLGPGEYWLPTGLIAKQALFTYQDIGLCAPAREKAMDLIGAYHKTKADASQPQIFVACELIEHLHHEMDIKADCERVGCNPDVIHMSTPLYTFDGRATQLNWQARGDIGHLRTYTPREFHSVVSRMFPEYNFELTVSNIMHMHGIKKEL